jgi:hypothetical protein
MDLKVLSQRSGIREHLLQAAKITYFNHVELPPHEIADDDTLPLAVAATILSYGINGDGIREFLRRIKPQLAEGKAQLAVDYRGDCGFRLQIDIARLKLRLGLCKH